MSDLAERIESTRFLGNELIVWLWFRTEVYQAGFEVPDVGDAEVWLETLIALEAPDAKTERLALRGALASGWREAKVALAEGKLPTQVKVHVRVDPDDWTCVLDARTLSRSQVQVPAKIKAEGDERFYERMALLDRLDQVLAVVFAEFSALRASPAWSDKVVPAIQAWLTGRVSLGLKEYRGLVRRAV